MTEKTAQDVTPSAAPAFKSTGRYSALRLLREALSGHRNWTRAWRKAEPRSEYEVVIIGGGGHGLATAYYLANHFGITNVAVIEKSRSVSATSVATRPSFAPPITRPKTSASTIFL